MEQFKHELEQIEASKADKTKLERKSKHERSYPIPRRCFGVSVGLWIIAVHIYHFSWLNLRRKQSAQGQVSNGCVTSSSVRRRPCPEPVLLFEWCRRAMAVSMVQRRLVGRPPCAPFRPCALCKNGSKRWKPRIRSKSTPTTPCPVTNQMTMLRPGDTSPKVQVPRHKSSGRLEVRQGESATTEESCFMGCTVFYWERRAVK